MSDDELRRLFDTVLTAPPPDTTDIDATIRTGRRRRRLRTVSLSSVAVLAVVGVAAAAFLPGVQREPVSPAASPAATSAPVTTAGQLLGSWQTIELDGQDVRAVRDHDNRPLGVTFKQDGTLLRWGANDLINYHSGMFSVSTTGQFQANEVAVTAMGSTRIEQQYLRNAEAVDQATEARLTAATPSGPPKLLLLTGREVVAVYTPAT